VIYNGLNVEQGNRYRLFVFHDLHYRTIIEGQVMDEVRAHLHIRGRVQGVSFRYYTRQKAVSKDVRGWVRNLWDGRVEAVFQGNEASVKEVIAWCRRGPTSAHVDDVRVDWETPLDDCTGFEIRSTARGG
jgi:acylphosphatase